jgi:hypothetical protein
VAEARLDTAGASQARAIAEGALFADLTVIIVLLGLYVPYAGPVLATISPLPLLLLLLRQGWRIGIQSAAVAVLLVGFLTGPLSALAVGVIAFRAASLGIGMRRGWRVPYTVLVGTTFFWIAFYSATIAVALAIPSWRAATEDGLKLTYNQGSAVLGGVFGLVGFGAAWHQTVHPQLQQWFNLFIHHWMLFLPLVAWPVLLIGVTAEYVIAEAILPPFGFKPRPLRLPFSGHFEAAARAREARKQGDRKEHEQRSVGESDHDHTITDSTARGGQRTATVTVEERVER